MRAERRVSGHGDVFVLDKVDESLLDEVGVVFDLEGCGLDFSVAEEIEDELAIEVADSNTLRHPLLDEVFHGSPGFLDRGIALHNFLAVVGEAGRVADGGIDVFEGDGKVHDEEVKVVDSPVLKLLFADGRYAVVVVERVPELGD